MGITRRSFLKLAAGSAAVAAMPSFASSSKPISLPTKDAAMTFTLAPLPYAKDALAPHISAQAFDFHHGKHHNAYVVKLNEVVPGSEFAGKSLEEIIMATAGKADKAVLFNNAAQHWNHSFFWHCMKPNGGGKPTGAVAAKIESDLGGYEKFAADFKNAALTQFGSGWAWLVKDASGKLKITKTGNADLPMAHGETALLTVDVWEHAYYIDYQNRRPDFVQTVLDKLVNWDFVNANYAGEQFKVAA
jgi:Fe-Mn family superoxide dismutase